MSEFDFDAALRWMRFDPKATLSRRDDASLPFVSEPAEAGQGLLLDTCVYIDQLQGQAPDVIADLLDIRQVNHSVVALQELLHTVGVLDREHKKTASVIRQIGVLIKAIPPHRIFAPDPDILGRAAILSGMLCRLQGYAKDDRRRALEDATLFLQAQRLGFTVLTRNFADFDCLLQMFPEARVLFYRRQEKG